MPATWIVRFVTRWVPLGIRRRLQDRGCFARLWPILARGSVRMQFGIAQQLRLSTAYVDLGGAQTYMVLRGVHEPTVQEAMRRVLRPGAVVWDVGANIGFLSLVAARLVGEGGRVYSLDPEPINVAAVAANARLNGVQNITAIHVAATARSGPVEIIGVSDTLWTRLASVGDHPLARERLRVRGVALDDLSVSDGLKPPDLVKIDVEGGEVEVLTGMTELLRTQRPAIIIEMHDTTARVCEILRRADYRLVNLDGPDPPELAGGEVHVLAQPRAADA